MSDRRDDDDFPEPIHDPEQLERARSAYASTYQLRRRVLRWAYVVLALLVLLVVILALTR